MVAEGDQAWVVSAHESMHMSGYKVTNLKFHNVINQCYPNKCKVDKNDKINKKEKKP